MCVYCRLNEKKDSKYIIRKDGKYAMTEDGKKVPKICPECGSMKRPEKIPPLVSGGSIATPSLVAGIMNAKYVNGMPLARQQRIRRISS